MLDEPSRETAQPPAADLPPEPALNPEKDFFSASKISLSIFFAALLIAGSVFYNGKIIFNKLNEIEGRLSQSQVLGDATGVVRVADRPGQPTIGNPDAKVTVYEFSDFQCPFCAAFFRETYPQIKSQYIDTGKVKLVYLHFPLATIHKNAQKAEEAAECANRQGKFEPYFNTLFTNSSPDGKGLEIADLKRYATNTGLNLAVFNKCLDNGEAVAAVNQDISEGQAVGVTGTPTFFINGQKVVGAQPFEVFSSTLDQAAKQ